MSRLYASCEPDGMHTPIPLIRTYGRQEKLPDKREADPMTLL